MGLEGGMKRDIEEGERGREGDKGGDEEKREEMRRGERR